MIAHSHVQDWTTTATTPSVLIIRFKTLAFKAYKPHAFLQGMLEWFIYFFFMFASWAWSAFTSFPPKCCMSLHADSSDKHHVIQGHAYSSPTTVLIINPFSFASKLFNSCENFLSSVKLQPRSPISLASWMEGFSVWIHLEGFSGAPSCRNLSNPVGLITYREQRSIHLITELWQKRCSSGVWWEIIGQLKFIGQRKAQHL